MTLNIGRNQNLNDTATITAITLNAATATNIAPVNLKRTFFEVFLALPSLASLTTDDAVFIRSYDALVDNFKIGPHLLKYSMGAVGIYVPNWRMPVDNIYTGAISAISLVGAIDVHILEY